MTQRADHITSITDEELNSLSIWIHYLNFISPTPSECCIFRVYEKLRTENEKAYEPNIIAIGPYYHDKGKLQEMELHKMRYLKLLLDRRKENSVDKYIMALSDKEDSVRKCYEESSYFLGKDECLRMMLHDGVFIIELFRKWKHGQVDDRILRSSKVLDLCSDLLLLENQIPFFILVELFNMTRDPNGEDDIISLAMGFLDTVLPGPERSHYPDIRKDDVKHLLHLVHYNMCFSFAAKFKTNDRMSLNELIKFRYIDTITELEEAGIEIKVAKGRRSLFEIKFDNGLIEIPSFFIHEHTESILRNLIAYEFLPDRDRRYVSDYAIFMDCLVNSSKDATYLRRHGIIENYLGDDIMVCNMLNKLNYGVSPRMDFSYTGVFNNVNRHSGSPYNKWMANLKRHYFNSPGSFISFMAAVVLLLLTLAQTIFSAFSSF